MRFAAGVVIVGAALSWQSAALAAPPAGDPKAREELKIGYELAQEGRCGEAVPHLSDSMRLEPRAITLINLADCEEKIGKLADAMVHWGDARQRASAEGQKGIVEEAANRATALEAKLPRLTIVLAKTAPAETVVERDGVALGAPSLGIALPVDPGPHTIVVKARGHLDAKKEISIKEGEKQTVDIDVGPAGDATPLTPVPATKLPNQEPEKKGGMSVLVPIGFGVAVVGLGVGAVTGMMAIGKGSDAEKACPNKQCVNEAARSDVDSGKTLGTVSTIAFIVGGAGVAIGVVGLVSGKKAEPKVDVGVGPGSLLLRGRF